MWHEGRLDVVGVIRKERYVFIFKVLMVVPFKGVTYIGRGKVCTTCSLRVPIMLYVLIFLVQNQHIFILRQRVPLGTIGRSVMCFF